jgi:hypothetical protein
MQTQDERRPQYANKVTLGSYISAKIWHADDLQLNSNTVFYREYGVKLTLD